MLFPLCWIYLLIVTILLLILNRGIWNFLLTIHFHGLTMSRRYANPMSLLSKQRLVFKLGLVKLLIESLVLSRLIYCLPLWGPLLTVSNINRLKSLQHRAIRLCLSLRKYDHITVLYSGYLWEVRFNTVHFVQCTNITFSLNTFHLYHQFSLEYVTRTTQFFA